MAETVKLTISPAVAQYVRPGTSLETRLSGCSAAARLPLADHVMLLFCLSKDKEPEIRSTALAALAALPAELIISYPEEPDAHPLILELLPKVCRNYPHPPAEQYATYPEELESSSEDEADFPAEEEPPAEPDDPDESEDSGDVEEQAEEYLSKYKTAQIMGTGEKIKMALTGDKEWRSILVKDANKLVSGSVIKNPRITEAEILTLVKSGIQNDEIMRLICANKEWVKNYQIRRALIENNRTPVQNAMRYLGTMGEKDLAGFAKSKNISSVISTMAKRLLLNKKK